ncbi:MAG: amidohydrolase family protein [Bacteroidota bacterium]|jgi:imidazolonepropionase-like amidohydrolase|nr:amidohydrolase family protein [Cytophagales bacterium]
MKTLKLALAITLLPLFLSAQSLEQKNYALINANLINGYENKIYPNSTVFVKQGKIEKIGKASDPTTGYEVIDCQGYFLMPGLIDAHTHLDNMAAAKRALETGVTTVRTAGVSAYQDVALMELVRANRLAGPDVVPAGVYVTPNLEETILADVRLGSLIKGVKGDDELRLLVNVNIDRGAKVIKTRGTERAGRPDTDPREQVYTEQQIRVIVQEAAKRNVPVMIHAHGDEGAKAAVLAGARSIEHGTFLSDETLQLMKQRGTFLVPTFITLEDLTQPGGDYVGSVLELRGRFMMPQAEKVFKKALELGVKIATGADNSYQAISTSRISLECAHFARMGMTNFQAIQSATTAAAELLKLDQTTGKIAPGFDADMILVPGNPLEEIRYLQDVLLVMSNGHLVLKRIPFGK